MKGRKQSRLSKLNEVLVLLYFFGGGLLFSFLAAGITEKLCLPIIAANIVLVIMYKISLKTGRLKVPLNILRCIIILMLAVVFVSPFIGLGFSKNKAFYPVKRAVFGYGVRGGRNMDIFLPKRLPDECDRYYFCTQLLFPAQDYSPHACLVVSCDRGSIREYADTAVKNGFEKEQRDCTFEEYLQEKNIKTDELSNDPELKVRVMHDYLNLPYYVFDSDSRGLTSDTEVYYCKASGSGCALDENSGIMIFWS